MIDLISIKILYLFENEKVEILRNSVDNVFQKKTSNEQTNYNCSIIPRLHKYDNCPLIRLRDVIVLNKNVNIT